MVHNHVYDLLDWQKVFQCECTGCTQAATWSALTNSENEATSVKQEEVDA